MSVIPTQAAKDLVVQRWARSAHVRNLGFAFSQKRFNHVALLVPQEYMSAPFKILSTDFDGTLHADHENPPVPENLQVLIARLQTDGVTWVINTGRDLSSLMEALARADLSIMPDYVVAVEREIYSHTNSRFIAREQWNQACTLAHQELFRTIQPDLPRLVEWINTRYRATIYEDVYSPFCLIARDNRDADAIIEYLSVYSREVPNLSIVRNDVYARLSHTAYNKGTALAEIARHLVVSPDHIVAAGDHFNDLPMLSIDYARWLIAPSNAIGPVKEAVQSQEGYVSQQPWGHGVAQALEHLLQASQLNECDLTSSKNSKAG